jgi:hypothetical protein
MTMPEVMGKPKPSPVPKQSVPSATTIKRSPSDSSCPGAAGARVPTLWGEVLGELVWLVVQ